MVEDTANVDKEAPVAGAEEPLPVETAPPAGPKVFTVEILRMIRDAQQQHGLRHGDYQRYRGYCTRRIARLRTVMRLPQGEKRHYKKRDVLRQHIDGAGADERFLHIPLMLAERAWSYAMQLRQESNTEPRKRFHLIGKLRKAAGWAIQLQELCAGDACDARTKLEADAYVAWMHGTLHFELALWRTSAENLKRAQMVYENLMLALPEEEQTVYRAKVDEITPSLRYCAYNIGESGTTTSIEDVLAMRGQGLVGNLDALVSQTKAQSSETLQTTEWRGRKVTVRPERVRLFLLSIQELDKSVAAARSAEAKIELIENVLIDCKDAIAAVRDEMKQDPKLRQPDSGAPVTAIQFLLAYLSYIRLMRTLERNIYLVAQAKLAMDSNGGGGETGGKPFDGGKRVRAQDLTRLYEIISQNVAELRQIAGMEEDVAYQREIEVLALSFKAFRCYYIAVTLVGLKRWKEAVALYERSVNYATEALAAKPQQFDLSTDLRALMANIEGCKFSAHAYSVLEDDAGEAGGQQRGQKSSAAGKPLYERLEVYREDAQLNTKNPNVFKLTADMQPIPCKPLFFDLALNFVEFPPLDDYVDAAAAKKAGAQGAGLSGFVKGFLGWGAGGGK